MRRVWGNKVCSPEMWRNLPLSFFGCSWFVWITCCCWAALGKFSTCAGGWLFTGEDFVDGARRQTAKAAMAAVEVVNRILELDWP